MHRRIIQNPVLRGDAAASLFFRYSIERAAYKPTPWDVAGQILVLQPGQYFACWREMADTTGLTVKQLRRAADKLAAAGMLTTEPRANRGNLVTVCNFLGFQAVDEDQRQTDGTTDGTTEVTTDGPTGGTLSKKKEPRRKKKDSLGARNQSSGFDRFWSSYPRRQGRGAAQKAWGKTAELRPPIVDLLEAVAQQSKQREWQRDSGRYVPRPASWLNQRRWEDEIEPALPVQGPDGLTISREYYT